jgi:hypothetical protein
MIAVISAYKNIIALGALVVLGGLIVSGIYMAGVRHEQRKWALEMADRNKDLAEQRGKDEAEIAAGDKAGKAADAVVAGAVSQSCVLTEQTAKLLASVR